MRDIWTQDKKIEAIELWYRKYFIPWVLWTLVFLATIGIIVGAFHLWWPIGAVLTFFIVVGGLSWWAYFMEEY